MSTLPLLYQQAELLGAHVQILSEKGGKKEWLPHWHFVAHRDNVHRVLPEHADLLLKALSIHAQHFRQIKIPHHSDEVGIDNIYLVPASLAKPHARFLLRGSLGSVVELSDNSTTSIFVDDEESNNTPSVHYPSACWARHWSDNSDHLARIPLYDPKALSTTSL